MITRVDLSTPQALNLSKKHIYNTFKDIVSIYDNCQLEMSGVKKTWDDSLETADETEFFRNVDAATLQLIFLKEHVGRFVHKDLISEFVRTYIPDAGLDQQVRHLGTQKHWYVLNKSAKVPNCNEKVPSGYHYLFTLEAPNPKAVAERLKRAGRVAATSFEDLKAAYGYRCATCNLQEGKMDPRTNQIVHLQQGHMDPKKKLTLNNTIPQCQYCNQTYKDYFVFGEDGRVKCISNPQFVLHSTPEVQKEMYRLLKETLD